MERTVWSDERLDDSFAELRQDVRDLRAEMREELRAMRAESRAMRAEMYGELRGLRRELFQLKLLILGSNVTILATVITLHG